MFQKRISDKDNLYFKRYIYFEYEEIDAYIEHLRKIYQTRVKQFNASLKFRKIPNKEKNNIIFTPVEKDAPFS
jgi:hypothetical protein